MKLCSNPLFVSAGKYSVEFLKPRPAIRITAADGTVMGDVILVSSVHTLTGRDVSSTMTDWSVRETSGCISMTAVFDSLIWKSKTVTLRFEEDRITYSVSVNGKGILTDAELLGGYYTGSNTRYSNARLYSGLSGDSLFNPEPDRNELYSRPINERSLIDMTGVPIPGRDGWFFTPPVFCYVLRNGKNCMTLGVTAEAGKNTFTELEYSGGSGQELLLRYEGYTEADGEYMLPDVNMIFGSDEYELLGEYAKITKRDVDRKHADWWKKTIFCGWGAQSALSQDFKCPAPSLANQKFYEQFTASLDEKGINPGIIVIDDKWMEAYGLNNVDTEKWPDMKGFIRNMHQKGRKVLLWLKAWDPEGVDPALCVRDFKGTAQAIDPENPAYLRLFADACREMLSSEGLDADGFKIDFTARIPSCPGCSHYGKHWGLELMRDYLSMVHDTAKAIKHDSLIMCHCPHPYLADKFDMIRLNDVNTGRPVCAQMIHRAKVVSAVLPDKLIDTDNWPMPDKKSWLDYVKIQPNLGVPSLYYLWHMDNSPEEISDADLDVVKDAWKRWYSKS